MATPARRALAWQFVDIINGARLECRLCGWKALHKGNTTNATRHLLKQHKVLYLKAKTAAERKHEEAEELEELDQLNNDRDSESSNSSSPNKCGPDNNNLSKTSDENCHNSRVSDISMFLSSIYIYFF